jgi:hypothetical protein
MRLPILELIICYVDIFSSLLCLRLLIRLFPLHTDANIYTHVKQSVFVFKVFGQKIWRSGHWSMSLL